MGWGFRSSGSSIKVFAATEFRNFPVAVADNQVSNLVREATCLAEIVLGYDDRASAFEPLTLTEASGNGVRVELFGVASGRTMKAPAASANRKPWRDNRKCEFVASPQPRRISWSKSSRHSARKSNPVRAVNSVNGQPAFMRNPKAANSPARASGDKASANSLARRPRSNCVIHRSVFDQFRARSPPTYSLALGPTPNESSPRQYPTL